MKFESEIVELNYWEHFKKAKDLRLVYPFDHPKLAELENAMNDILSNQNEIKICNEHNSII